MVPDSPSRLREHHGVWHAVGIPNIGLFGDPDVLLTLASEAEGAGWDGVFVWDHLLYREPSWPVADPTVTIGAVAAATRRVRVGVMVTALPRRRPWKVAREVATLQRLTGGRAIFGAGLGSMSTEFSAFGEPSDDRERAARLDEGLDVLTRLWSGEPVTHRGTFLTVENVQMTPRVQVPVWIAGRWPNKAPFRRAARFDGVFPTHADYGKGTTMPAQELARILDEVERHRAPDREPPEVALEGQSEPGETSKVEAYVEAGLTCWVEALGWWRGGVEEALQRVRAGPPGERSPTPRGSRVT